MTKMRSIEGQNLAMYSSKVSYNNFRRHGKVHKRLLLVAFYLFVLFAIRMLAEMNYEANVSFELTDTDIITEAFGGPTLEYTNENYFCDEEEIQNYTVCNGFSNQLLGHAGFISNLIEDKKDVTIPDAFIFNGVQVERDSNDVLKQVTANKDNSIPLTSIIDGNILLETIRSHGVNACFISHDKVIKETERMECSWLQALESSNNNIELELLDAMKPSVKLSKIIDSVFSNLEKQSPNFNITEGVCLHHRNGLDWQMHCSKWQGNNCLNFEGRNIEELIKDRIPSAYSKKWMYYIGDETPSITLTESIQRHANINLFHIFHDNLLNIEQIHKQFGIEKINLQKHRDIFAAIDFFICEKIPSFMGNSVSTFSAFQIARRRGRKSTWYNSRSNPLLTGAMQIQNIPIVYTYTEESALMGKILLKASILSVRQTFGMEIDINIIYLGEKDELFLKWLVHQNVIIHKHDPKWLSIIDNMIEHSNPLRSHLYSHRGNYIGTWQRIDIPLFIDSEYSLFLDADTIVHSKFDLSTFGLDITPGIAMSDEFSEDSRAPINAGVMLLNVPKLRETYKNFLLFIQKHADANVDFYFGPSDQGAYLDFYHAHRNSHLELKHKATPYVKYLDNTFNVKPYWKNNQIFYERKIIHFHGMKPHQILQALMGKKKQEFSPVLYDVLTAIMEDDEHELLCLSLHDFAVALVEDEKNFKLFCQNAFPLLEREMNFCLNYLKTLATKNVTTEKCAK